MKVRLLWIERDLRGTELVRREETLTDESGKRPTRNYVGRLVARHHSELASLGKVSLIQSDKPGYRWYVRSTPLGPNCWVTVYAEPLDEGDLASPHTVPS
jgi:hypothetical protein